MDELSARGHFPPVSETTPSLCGSRILLNPARDGRFNALVSHFSIE
ncbi:MAG: hypothetical protein OJF50_002570 [Nitrospira sp.]|nr:hypothetical protein [Nitrospira sp.]